MLTAKQPPASTDPHYLDGKPGGRLALCTRHRPQPLLARCQAPARTECFSFYNEGACKYESPYNRMWNTSIEDAGHLLDLCAGIALLFESFFHVLPRACCRPKQTGWPVRLPFHSAVVLVRTLIFCRSLFWSMKISWFALLSTSHVNEKSPSRNGLQIKDPYLDVFTVGLLIDEIKLALTRSS